MPKLKHQLCQACRSHIVRDLKNEKRVKQMFEDAIARGEDPYAAVAGRAGELAREEEGGEGEVELAGEGGVPKPTPTQP